METENNEAEFFGTETMAELCARQGRLAEAIAIYRRLIQNGPDDARRARHTSRFQSLERALGQTGDGKVAAQPPPARATAPAAAGPPAAPRTTPTPTEPRPREIGIGEALVLASPIHRLPILITQPVRSGQVVRAEKNDIIVLASVNPGAQLVADGNIHVYGALRGQAIAGAMGCTEARIFCQKLEPELLAINGIYLIYEDIPPGFLGGPAQIFLQNDRCMIERL